MFEEKIKSLGIVLPEAPEPLGSYSPVIVSGSLAFISGQIAKTHEGKILEGKVGDGLNLEEGQKAAQIACANLLSVIGAYLTFEKVKRIVRITGYVQVSPQFYSISQIVNSCSEILEQVFGEKGKHARSAVGVVSLPLNSAVEIDAMVEIK